MKKNMQRAALVAICAAFACLAAVQIAQNARPARADDASNTYNGTWRLSYLQQQQVDVEVGYRNQGSTWEDGRSYTFAQSGVQGLTLDQVEHLDGEAHFSIVRDAGTFDCRGYFEGGNGSGVFTFIPNASFAAALEARGINRPDVNEQFRLAFSNITLAYVDQLKAAGVSGLTTDGLIRLADHDVSAAFVSALHAGGIQTPSVD